MVHGDHGIQRAHVRLHRMEGKLEMVTFSRLGLNLANVSLDLADLNPTSIALL
jgi:hypothetical protein